MIVALSSEAAPRASLPELAEACAQRGVQALQLAVDHTLQLQVAAEVAERYGVRIVALRISAPDAVAPAMAARLGAAVFATENLGSEWQANFRAHGGQLVSPLELNPQLGNVDEQYQAALAAGPVPTHIILRGGGPEAAQFEGRGIGTLMTRLSIAGNRGVLVIAPSAPAVTPVWQTWLRRAGWGCGSKTADASLVQLGNY